MWRRARFHERPSKSLDEYPILRIFVSPGFLLTLATRITTARPDERLTVARHERDVMRNLATQLRESGIEVPTVSIGSTPTITIVDHLDGIDEARPGNYIFFDAFQAAIGNCSLDDCALTVLAAVVHRDLKRNKIVIDAGAIALSKDRGAIEFDPTCGYGRVLDLEGHDTGFRDRLTVTGTWRNHWQKMAIFRD